MSQNKLFSDKTTPTITTITSMTTVITITVILKDVKKGVENFLFSA